MRFTASTWLVVCFVALASSLDNEPGTYRRDIVNFPDQILPRQCNECCPITIRTILTTIYSTIYSDKTIYTTTTETTTEKTTDTTTETTTETSISTKMQYITNSTTLYVTLRPSCSVIPCATGSVTLTVTAPGPVTTITTTTTTTAALPYTPNETTITNTPAPSRITEPQTQTVGAPSTTTESHLFSVTLCPVPTGLSAPLDPSSDRTFGCKPGRVCNPPKPEGCSFWPDPPSEDYLCDPDYCIPSPPYSTASWDECDNTTYYPPSDGYFNLNPEKFGLSYHIFEDPGKWVHRRQEAIKLAITPAVCFDDCNNAYIIALSVGKTDKLCADGSAFRESYDSCTTCIIGNTNSPVNNVLDYLRSEFSQFINFCNGKLPVEKPSSSPTPEPVETTQPSVVTSTQVETTSSVFTPIEPSTIIQTSQSAPVSTSSSQDQSSEISASATTTTTAAVTATTTSSSTISPSSVVGETSDSPLPVSSSKGSTSMGETTSEPTTSTTQGDYSSTGGLGSSSSPPITSTTKKETSGKPTITHAPSGSVSQSLTPPVVTAGASHLSYQFTSMLIFLASLMLIIY